MQRLDEKIIDKMCRAFSLGESLRQPQEISGGLLHVLWRLETTTGSYAVKRIDKEHTLQLEHNLVSAEHSQQIADYMAKRHVPTVVALQRNGSYVFLLDHVEYLVMPWIEGVSLPLTQVSINMVEKVGQLLGQIHRVHYPVEQFKKPKWQGLEKEEWLAVIDSLKSNVSFKEEIYGQLSSLVSWSKQANAAASQLQQNLIFSHRDLDFRNILWLNSERTNEDIPSSKQSSPPNHLILLDWEYAGLINPDLDLLIVGLNWSGVLSGFFDEHHFHAVIKGFVKETKTKPEITAATLGGYYGYCLDWLLFNLQKFTDDPTASSNSLCYVERRTGYQQEILQTLRALHLVASKEKEILRN